MRFATDRMNSIAGFLDDKPSYDKIGVKSRMNAAQDEVNVALNNASTADAVLRGKGAIAATEANADATRAIGGIQGQASAVSGIAGAVGSLGSSFSSALRSSTPSSGGFGYDFWNSRNTFG